jgi:hypothetical protein
MTEEIEKYNTSQTQVACEICSTLQRLINQYLNGASSRIWHGHPVWFLNENPIVGYSQEKRGVRLMFWSGADFDEPQLHVVGKKFKDASIFYNAPEEINAEHIQRWLNKSIRIQWDYKNIVKRKGKLERIM